MTTPRDVEILLLVETDATLEDVRDRMWALKRDGLMSAKVRQNWVQPLYHDAARLLCRDLHRIGMWEEVFSR